MIQKHNGKWLQSIQWQWYSEIVDKMKSWKKKNRSSRVYLKCPLYGLSPQSRSQSDSGKHKEYTMYYTKPVPINWDNRGSFDLQRHGKEHTSRVMCLKDTQLQKPLRQSQRGPTHWMPRWIRNLQNKIYQSVKWSYYTCTQKFSWLKFVQTQTTPRNVEKNSSLCVI